jgi:integrase
MPLRQVQIVNPKTGVRTTIRVPGGRKVADTVKGHCRQLAASVVTNTPPDAGTKLWLAGAGDDLRQRLANAGLCDPPKRAITLAEAWAECVDDASIKTSTATVRSVTRNHQLRFWGGDTTVCDITVSEAERFDRWLRRPLDGCKIKSPEQRENTARKHVKVAKALLVQLVKRGVVSTNPFAGLPSNTIATRWRKCFVENETIEAVLSQIDDVEFRLLVAATRWLGWRVGSEPRRLLWVDVDLVADRVKIHDSKRSLKIEGEEIVRSVPLPGRLKPYFEAARANRDASEPFVFPSLKNKTDQALRKPLAKAITAAKIVAWPKPWQNLRASRETELLDEGQPLHAVCAWIGNSPQVAMDSYLMLRDRHYDAAVAGRSPSTHGAESDEIAKLKATIAAMQKAMQQATASSGRTTALPRFDGSQPHLAALECNSMGRKGLEPLTSSL